MRSIICVVIMLALIGLTGCGNNDAPSADQTVTESETVVATEDFESGKAETMVEEVDEVVEEAPADDQH